MNLGEWKRRPGAARGGRKRELSKGTRLDAVRTWEKKNTRRAKDHSATWMRREKFKKDWADGKFLLLCHVCGHEKTTDKFDFEQRFRHYPWCRPCVKENQR